MPEDILYGDNMFVTTWEEGEDPFLDILTEDNRDRINSERWHLVCDTENLGDCSYIYNCDIYMEIRRGSIYVYMHVYDYGSDDEKLISFVFWDEEFIPRFRAILEMSVPQSTTTKVFLNTDPVFSDWMLDDVRAIFNDHLAEGYETWRL